MKDSEVLKAAKALIEKPECWIKGTEARGKEGRDTHPNNSDAVAFCSLGAVRRVKWVKGTESHWQFLKRSVKKLSVDYHYNPVAFNDAMETKHKDVMEMFDLAICMAECEEETGASPAPQERS